MRFLPAIVGGILTAVGAVWIVQGAGVLKGSFMTGQQRWLWIGIVCAVVGLVVFTRGLRAGRR
ncbi:MAG TPA: hypothetical protein VLX89_03135 [Actinomycetota bacterium]|nr:hypothetical protein [Actinomycetota bacterium]